MTYTEVMTCTTCGATNLVAVLLPGHADVQAVLCLTCTAVQPTEQAAQQRD